eukprot:TRINITY_DN327_c0_g1_i1.p1 TRINITY_DN327_c0_g1~~TRINITY_DN327_c0_g1_i1.p1  ORF type:complete len:652 (+),score=199.04 TRINITY_DN327_c0_g1_i1:107-2062(+)
MDAELKALNEGLPPGWEAMREEEEEGGSIYYFHRALEVKTSDRPQIYKQKNKDDLHQKRKKEEEDLNGLISEIDSVLDGWEESPMKKSNSKTRANSRSRSATQEQLSMSMDRSPSRDNNRHLMQASPSMYTSSEPSSPITSRLKAMEHSNSLSVVNSDPDIHNRQLSQSSGGISQLVAEDKKKISKSGGGVLSKLFKKKEDQMNAEESVAYASHLKTVNSGWEKERSDEAERWMNTKENIREKKWDPNPIPSELDAKTASVIDWGCTTHGFNLEFGKEDIMKEELQLEEISKHTNFYQLLFAEKEHYNFVGQDEILGPVVISIEGVSAAGDNKNLRVILRTKKGDERLVVPRPFNQNFPDNPDVLMKMLKGLNASISGIRFCRVTDAKQHSDLVVSLLSYEKQLIQKGYKFGVLYVANGQKDENQMFNNVNDSPGFREFLDIISDKIDLKGFTQFSGGLDTKSNSTGTQSYHTTHRGVQVMLHVSTLLPYFPKDLQQVERKRHLGNDVVMLIYKDGDAVPFDPRIIASQFNHVFCVVQPEGGGYRIQFANKFGVKPYSPAIEKPPLFEKDRSLRDFLLTKLINGERAAMYAPDFRGTLARTREVLLKSMVSNHWVPSPKGLRKNFSFMGGTKKRSGSTGGAIVGRGSMSDH